MTTKTQKYWRKRWVKALRSGRYKQGTDYLCRDGRHCCLGVLARIVRCKKEPLVNNAVKDKISTTIQFDKTLTVCPEKAMEAVGLKTDLGVFNENGFSKSLTDLNDTGKTFKEIADIIEEEPEGLFVK